MSASNAFQKKFFTGHAFFTPTGGKMIELADLEEIVYVPDVQRIESWAVGKGVLTKDVQVAKSIAQRFDMTTNRTSKERLQLILSANAPSDVVQGSATGTTKSFVAVYKGQPLDLGKEKVSAVALLKGATPLVVNTDYTVDLDTGIVRLELGSSVYTDGDTIDATFNVAAVTRKTYTPQVNINQYGTAKMLLFDTGSAQGRVVATFDAQLTCDEQITLSGNEIVKPKFKFLVLGALTWGYLQES